MKIVSSSKYNYFIVIYTCFHKFQSPHFYLYMVSKLCSTKGDEDKRSYDRHFMKRVSNKNTSDLSFEFETYFIFLYHKFHLLVRNVNVKIKKTKD